MDEQKKVIEDLFFLLGEETADDFDDETPKSPSFILKPVALFTVLAFILMVMVPMLRLFSSKHPSAEIFRESTRLSEDLDARLLNSTVKIKVVTEITDISTGLVEKAGTGFNIDPHGIIITNHHVIENANKITIIFPDGGIYNAKSWASKPDYDLAVIKLEQNGLPSIPLNLDNAPAPGESLLVIGNPLDFNSIAVEGILERYILLEEKPTPVLYMDLPVYPGNSGSPVLDASGRVVGVVFGFSVYSNGGLVKSYGLAMPIKEVIDLL